jgi:hypothetical protein
MCNFNVVGLWISRNNSQNKGDNLMRVVKFGYYCTNENCPSNFSVSAINVKIEAVTPARLLADCKTCGSPGFFYPYGTGDYISMKDPAVVMVHKVKERLEAVKDGKELPKSNLKQDMAKEIFSGGRVLSITKAENVNVDIQE